MAGSVLAGTLAAPTAFADDPLAPIIQTIQTDRQKACHDVATAGQFAWGFVYNKDLEAVAQQFARSEKSPSAPARFQSVISFLGSGDPQAQAINNAYRRGAGQAIGNCNNKYYGVGFVRHEDRSVDVVTIVFGALRPNPPDPNARPAGPIK